MTRRSRPLRSLAALLPLLAPLALAAPAQAVPVGTSADTRPAAPQHRPQWQTGGANIQLGGSVLQGNVNLTSLNTSLALNYNWGPHQFFVDAGNFYNATATDVLVNRVAGSALYAFSARENFNLYGYSTHSHDRSIQLDYRATTGLGACVHRLFAPAFSLFLLSLNPAFEYERFQDGSIQTAWRGVARLNAIKPLGDGLEAGFDGFYTPNLADFSDLRLYGEAYLRVKLWTNALALRLTLADEYDSQPQPGIRPNDLGAFTTLEFNWGQ